MTKLLPLIALWICIVYSEARRSDCPSVACPYIMYPPNCRTTTFFIDVKSQKGNTKDQICQGCDQCIKKEKDRDLVDGCPSRFCTTQMIPDHCRRERYFVYRGRKICRDCPEDTCVYQY